AFVPSDVPPGWLGGEPMALMVRVPAPRGGTAIDLCAGSGVPALNLASAGAHVVAVEPDARVARLARLNVAMADLDGHIDVRDGGLWLAAPGERFDRLVCAPPSVPLPPDLAAAGRSGGGDGIAVLRRVLAVLPRILAHGGTAH